MKKIIPLILYVIGVCSVISLLALAIIGGDHVSYPDAMIPYTDYERYIIILSLGCIPMLAVCIITICVFEVKRFIFRLLILIPGIVAAIPFLGGFFSILSMMLTA